MKKDIIPESAVFDPVSTCNYTLKYLTIAIRIMTDELIAMNARPNKKIGVVQVTQPSLIFYPLP